VPLWTATGAGSVARQIMGTIVIGGMVAATAIAIFIIPALFVLVERLAKRRGGAHSPALPQPSHRRRTDVRRLIALSLVILLSSGCAVGPNYKRPSVNAPDSYRGAMTQAAPQPAAESLGDQKWWEVFQDKQLPKPNPHCPPAELRRSHRGNANSAGPGAGGHHTRRWVADD